jgi:hypothetical protein
VIHPIVSAKDARLPVMRDLPPEKLFDPVNAL